MEKTKKLKGAKQFKKVINDFTKTFGIKAYWATEFEAHPEKNKIGFTILVDSDMDECFLADAETRYPEIHAHLFLWLLMHEIGHCKTEYLWTAEDTDYFEEYKNKLNDYFGTDSVSNNTWYHLIGDEYMATKWAGEYMMAHPKKMKKFCNKLNEAVTEFYKKNELSLDKEASA